MNIKTIVVLGSMGLGRDLVGMLIKDQAADVVIANTQSNTEATDILLINEPIQYIIANRPQYSVNYTNLDRKPDGWYRKFHKQSKNKNIKTKYKHN